MTDSPLLQKFRLQARHRGVSVDVSSGARLILHHVGTGTSLSILEEVWVLPSFNLPDFLDRLDLIIQLQESQK